jgi:hypothetical protein
VGHTSQTRLQKHANTHNRTSAHTIRHVFSPGDQTPSITHHGKSTACTGETVVILPTEATRCWQEIASPKPVATGRLTRHVHILSPRWW